eukprot:TRINITY_DN3987_c0_g1_i1.p1 TRINITY_DN3987_c0_g1~~TRINITY_DN3987_c0_g1_i1.p1  ORF type:complete len:534 (+),score=147.78 TRINITY_DN3987_c0_g1_i1:110-1711(+)
MNFLDEKHDEDNIDHQNENMIVDNEVVEDYELNEKDKQNYENLMEYALVNDTKMETPREKREDDKEKDPKKEKKREKLRQAVKEFVDTEKSYVECLTKYVFHYKKKLESPNLDVKKELALIFINSEKILEAHASIIRSIFEDQKSNDCKIKLEFILKIVPKLLSTENLYKEYVVKHEYCDPKMQVLLKNKKFLNFFEKFCGGKESKGKGKNVLLLEFGSLCITPIQRFPRYILLFDTVLHNMEKDDFLYNDVKKARILIDRFCKNINSHKATKELRKLDLKSSGNMDQFRSSTVPWKKPNTSGEKTLVNRKEELTNFTPHQWNKKKLSTPEYCISCKNAISTKHSFRCKICKLHCHQECQKPMNCAGKLNGSIESSYFKREYLRNEEGVTHTLIISMKKKDPIHASLYLFNDLLCVTKPSKASFNVLYVLKFHSDASDKNMIFQKIDDNSIMFTNSRRASENHLITFPQSYLRNSWFIDIQKTFELWQQIRLKQNKDDEQGDVDEQIILDVKKIDLGLCNDSNNGGISDEISK